MKPDPGDDAAIRRYVRDNRATYSSTSIRGQLLAAGHPADAVDRVLAEEFAGAPEPMVDVRGRAVVAALLIFLGAAVLVGFAFGSNRGPYIPDIAGSTAFALLYFLPGFLISLVAIALVSRRPVARSEVGSALMAGLAVPVVVAVAMTGICLSQLRG